MQFGFPEITNSFLDGQDIMYTQFNEIDFYVEDVEQENFYFVILKKIFPDINFEKIFPLGGKSNVVINANLNLRNKKKVFLLDLDFDEVLGNKKTNNNIFYLKKYSIENYLLEFNSIRELIIEQKPRLNYLEIERLFSLENFLLECKTLFSEVIQYYLVIQKFELGIENVNCGAVRFCDFNPIPSIKKQAQIERYHIEIETKLKTKNSRLSLRRQLSFFKKYFKSIMDSISNIPGKYLIHFLKHRIENIFGLTQINLESFTFRLAKNCEFAELAYLRNSVNAFIR